MICIPYKETKNEETKEHSNEPVSDGNTTKAAIRTLLCMLHVLRFLMHDDECGKLLPE